MANKKIISLLVIMLSMLGSIFVVYADSDDASLKISLMNQDPDPVGPNDYVEVRFKVEKIGNDPLEDITFKISEDYPFSLDPDVSPIREIGSWKGYSVDDKDNKIYYILYYKLRVAKDVLEEEYPLKLYYKVKGWSSWATYKAYIRVNNDRADFDFGNLETFPKKLISDTDGAELDVELQNIGEKDAQNVVLELNLPKGFEETYGYSNRVNLGTIPFGSSKIAKFFIDIDEDVESGNHPVNATVFYKEVDSNIDDYLNKSLKLNIPIKSRPKFEIVDYKLEPENITSNDEAKIVVKIKNIGKEEAKSTSVKVYKESSQPFDFNEKTDYIGKLKPGETGEAVFTFSVDENAEPKMYLLDLEIRTIFEDNILAEEKVLKIPVREKGKNNLLTSITFNQFIIGILVIIFVLSLMLIFKIKSRKKSKIQKK